MSPHLCDSNVHMRKKKITTEIWSILTYFSYFFLLFGWCVMFIVHHILVFGCCCSLYYICVSRFVYVPQQATHLQPIITFNVNFFFFVALLIRRAVRKQMIIFHTSQIYSTCVCVCVCSVHQTLNLNCESFVWLFFFFFFALL